MESGTWDAKKVTIVEMSREMFAMSCADNPLASYYSSALNHAGRYLSAFHEGEPLGYAVCKARDNDHRLTLCLLFVQERYRRRGIATRLLKEVEASCRLHGEHTIKCQLSEDLEGFAFIRDFLEKHNYMFSDKLFVFWCDGYGNPGYVGWEQYMEKRGERLIRWLEEEGFSVVALEDADEALISALRTLGTSDDDLDLSPLLDGRQGPLSRKISCITVKDGRPAAFCMANEPDSVSIVFEQMGVVSAYKNTGAILPAISASIRRCKKFGYQRVLYSIFESNVSALSFANRVLSNVTSKKKVQHNYFKHIDFTPEEGMVKNHG